MLRAKMLPFLGPALHSCWVLGIPQFEPQLGAFQLFLSVIGIQIYNHSNSQRVCDKNPLLAYQRGVFCNPSGVLRAGWGGKKKPLGSTCGIIINQSFSGENGEPMKKSAWTSWKLTPGLAPPLNQQRVLSKLFVKKPGDPSGALYPCDFFWFSEMLVGL